MEIIANIWDRVLVIDDLIDLKTIDEYSEYLESLGEYTLAYIQSGEDKVYDAGSGVFQSPSERNESKYVDKLLNDDIIPKLPNHKTAHVTKVHKMNVGSLMAIHTDCRYSIAVTTYITDCIGGELVVEHPETKELSKIEPKRGRTIVLKCDTPHSVLEVIEGERKSLQTFVTYYKQDGDDE